MWKVGDVVTVYIDPCENKPWKNTGVITEIDDRSDIADLLAGEPLYNVQFLDNRIGWWYLADELHNPTRDDMMEVIRRRIMR